MKNKKMVGIIAAALAIALLIFIILFPEKKDEATGQLAGDKTSLTDEKDQNKTESNIDFTSPENKEETTTSPKTESPSSLLYGEVDDTADYYDETLDSSEDNHSHDVSTIFDKTKDTKSLIKHNLNKPVILKGSTMSYNFGDTILAKNGYIAVLAEGFLLYYTPTSNEIKQIGENVSKAKASEDGKYIIFEEKQKDSYTTYSYEFPIPEDGKVELLNTKNSLRDLGIIDKLFYFAPSDDENFSYYYSPFNTTRDASKLDYFSVGNTSGTTSTKGIYLTYNEEAHAYHTFEGRGKNQKKVLTLPTSTEKNLTHLKVNPYASDSKILSGVSRDSNYVYAEKIFVDDELVEGLTDIKDIYWMDENTLIYSDFSFENSLVYYDLTTKEKHILDTNVNSITYDAEEKIIYYVTQDNKIRKITVSN